MTQVHAQGRLGYTLNQLSHQSLMQLLDHLPPDDPLLQGQSLAIIMQRIADFQEQNDE